MFDPVETLKEYIRCQSVSADPAYRAGMEQAREFVAGLLRRLGMRVEVCATAGHPVVMGQRGDNPRWPHVVIYGHYDVQPPDPLAQWTTQPFVPEVRGDRIHGRGAADNKGPLMVHLSALADILAQHPDLPLRITVAVEGEEEIGSPNFGDFLQANRERLKCDLFFLSDTGNASAEQVIITCGLRGIITLEVEVTGPRTDLHSGFHGGVLHNPLQALCELLATLHDADGRVAIDGYYADVAPVEQWERAELRKHAGDADAYRQFLGIPRFYTPPGFTPFEAIRFLPTLELNGIGGGYQGEGSKTVIPARAFAKLSCRLAADQDPEKMYRLVEQTLLQRCPPGVRVRVIRGHSGRPYLVVPPGKSNTPHEQSPALATAFAATEEAVTSVFGRAPLYLREGGSIPIIAEIKRVLGVDSVMLGMFLPEDNLHAPNESFHLGVMKKGIRVSRHVLSRLAGLSEQLPTA